MTSCATSATSATTNGVTSGHATSRTTTKHTVQVSQHSNTVVSDDTHDELVCVLKEFGYLLGVMAFGYVVGQCGLSPWWCSLAAGVLVYRRQQRVAHHRRVHFQGAVRQDERSVIKCAVSDLPGWVYFPDTERAEWVNKTLKQMWPFLTDFMTTVLKTQVEQNIDNIMPDYCKGFRFEKIDFGTVPLRLGSVKCYDENTGRNEIILDLELIYAGNCDIQVKIKGLSAGIREFQLYGVLRVELKPLIKESPLIGAVSLYFLQNPIIEYNFTNLGNILEFPLLSVFLKEGIKEQFAKLIVLPNKYVLPLVDNLQTTAIKFTQPIGVVRLEVVEASHLKKSDVGMLGLGKSDPYVNIIVGNQEFRTPTIVNTVNPKWNFICETPVFFATQSIDLEVMDEDQGSKDDFLGKASFSLDTISKEGIIDAWINLKETKTGKIHLKATWLSVEHSTHNLTVQSMESERIRAKYKDESNENHVGSVACVMIYLDCAKNLPISAKSIGEPSPQVIFRLGRSTQKSIVKNFTFNPIWEESFHFLMNEYNNHDELVIEVVNTRNNQEIGQVSVRLQSLAEAKEMTFTEPLLVRHYSHNFDLYTTVSLYFLKVATVERVKIVREDTVDSNDSDNIPTMEDLIKGTVEPFAKMSGFHREIVSQYKRPPVHFNGKSQLGSGESGSNVSSAAMATVETDNDLAAMLSRSSDSFPMLEVTVNKIVDQNKLEVVLHKASNLRKVNNKLPDPYVKMHLVPESNKDKHNRSLTVKNNCNPVFEERFLIDLNETVESLKFVVYTHTSTSKMFKRNKIVLGFVEIYLNENLDKNVSFTKWYELEQQDD